MIEITRVYRAPRERVWAAWTEPEQLAVWWGKRGWNAQLDSIVLDVRPGGTFRVTSHSEDGDEMTNEYTFSEVVPFERLAFGPGPSGSLRDSLTAREAVVAFADLGDGFTEMTFRTPVPSERAAAGVRSAFDRLGEHLQEAA